MSVIVSNSIVALAHQFIFGFARMPNAFAFVGLDLTLKASRAANLSPVQLGHERLSDSRVYASPPSSPGDSEHGCHASSSACAAQNHRPQISQW
jgi:hypothetical protein